MQDAPSYRVVQRAAGATMSVDVSATGVFNKAYVRGSTIIDQGLYRVEATGVWNLDIAAADGANPRIDQIFLVIEDQQHAGTNNLASIRVVTGAATGGATLDNRTGAGAAPASSELLADVLVPAASASVVTANIRDRRRFGNFGAIPVAGTVVDQVQFMPHPMTLTPFAAFTSSVSSITQTFHDNMQAAALMWLPRRITATKVRWKYVQGSTAAATAWTIWICDASGRNLNQVTGPPTFAGAANSLTEVAATINSMTFDVGWYYVGFGVAAMTASSTVGYVGVPTGVVGSGNAIGGATRNLTFRSATGGSGAPQTILAFTDTVTLAGNTISVPVPLIALSAA